MMILLVTLCKAEVVAVILMHFYKRERERERASRQRKTFMVVVGVGNGASLQTKGPSWVSTVQLAVLKKLAKMLSRF